MTWTPTITGNLCVCIGAIMLFPCALSSRLHSNPPPVQAPTIINVMHRHSSHRCRITCKVNPGGLTHETLVYWLADGEFVEMVHKNVSLTTKVKKSHNGTEYILTRMVFRRISPQVLNTTFTCVALNPAGFDKKTFHIEKNK